MPAIPSAQTTVAPTTRPSPIRLSVSGSDDIDSCRLYIIACDERRVPTSQSWISRLGRPARPSLDRFRLAGVCSDRCLASEYRGAGDGFRREASRRSPRPRFGRLALYGRPEALAKRFVALVKASPASDARLAFVEVYGSEARLREPAVRVALRVVGRRELAAGSTVGSSRMREALSFTLAGAEALWRGADLPADYELAADSFVTAGDATQVLGDLEWSLRCWQSARSVYATLLKDDSLGNAYRSRIERKLQRTDDDIGRCSSQLEDPSEPAPPPSPTISRSMSKKRS